MHKIAFFGAGLMGTGFVKRARANGIEVNVWNRSPAKAISRSPAHRSRDSPVPGSSRANSRTVRASRRAVRDSHRGSKASKVSKANRASRVASSLASSRNSFGTRHQVSSGAKKSSWLHSHLGLQ